jgi:TonB family protein
MHIIEDKPSLWPFVLVSLLIHALILLLLPRMVPAPNYAEKSIEIVPVSEAPAPAKSAYRIADIPEPEVQQKPKDAKFLGMYDSTVTQESVSAITRPGKSGEKGKGAAKEKQEKSIAKKEPSPKHGNRLLAFDPNLFGAREKPQPEKHASAGGGGSLDDFYPDFRRGAHTYLNVLRYPDVEYFVRLKRAFKMTFNPEGPLREYFSQNIVSRGSIDVVLGVCVDKMGNLAELFVFRSSGIPSYDNEALRTVRASSPFATPPAKFTDDDGLLRMSWTFSVYL